MRSNIRVFKDKGFTANGNVLPFDKFDFCPEVKGDRRINDEFGAYMVKRAEEVVNEEIPLIPLSLYRDFKLTGVRSRFERLHHHRRYMLLYLTFAEAYERKGRFVEKAADVLWAILEETSWIIPAHYGHSPQNPNQSFPENYREDQIPGVDLYVANCCSIVSLAKYLLKDELDAISPAICKRIDHEVILRGINPFVTIHFTWSGQYHGSCNNWCTDIVSNLLFAAGICVEDYELRCRVIERAMLYLDNFSACYPVDGSCDEGPGYWGGAGGEFFDALEMIEDMTGGKITVYDNPLVKKMGEYIAAVNIDGDFYLNFADAKPHLIQDGKRIMLFGEKCGSPELYSFGKMTAKDSAETRSYTIYDGYRLLKNALTPEVHEADKVLGKEYTWFEDNKIAIFRECTDTSRGLYLATKGGHNAESHNHKDVGCLVVFSNGKPVIVDPSHGSYDNGFFGPTRYQRWYMKSSYHSVPTVNGYEQSLGSEASSKSEVFSPETKTVSMELKAAFPKEAGIASMVRECHMESGFITVTDTVKCESESDVCFNYLMIDEPSIIEDGRLSISDGRTFEFNPEGLETVIEKVENTFLPYEDLNFERVWHRECLWRIVLKARAVEKSVTVKIY